MYGKIKEVLKRHWPILLNDPFLKKILLEEPRLTFRSKIWLGFINVGILDVGTVALLNTRSSLSKVTLLGKHFQLNVCICIFFFILHTRMNKHRSNRLKGFTKHSISRHEATANHQDFSVFSVTTIEQIPEGASEHFKTLYRRKMFGYTN